MGASPYILGLRALVGQQLLQLSGVCVIVLREGPRGQQLLLVRRSDTGEWTPVTGIVDPGDDVDETAIRECQEEAGVDVHIERVTWIETLAPITYPNGDQCQFLDVCLLANYVGGEAQVGDEESTDVRWFDVDDLPTMSERFERKIRHALSGDTKVLIGANGR